MLILSVPLVLAVLAGCESNTIGLLGRIEGHLTTEEDEAVVGHSVDLVRSGEVSRTANTDGTGRYEFVDVPFGDSTIVPHPAPLGFEWDPPQAQVTTSDVETEAIADFVMRVGGQGITGTLQTAAGEPVVDHTVALAQAPEVSSAAAKQFPTVQSAQDGSYVFGGIPPGDYVVAPDPAPVGVFWDPQQRQVSVVQDQVVRDQDFTLRPLVPPGDCGPDAVCGRLTGIDGNPFTGHAIELLSHIDGSVIDSVLSDQDGEFVFPDVAPGEYT
jgi:hypothetical protein